MNYYKVQFLGNIFLIFMNFRSGKLKSKEYQTMFN